MLFYSDDVTASSEKHSFAVSSSTELKSISGVPPSISSHSSSQSIADSQTSTTQESTPSLQSNNPNQPTQDTTVEPVINSKYIFCTYRSLHLTYSPCILYLFPKDYLKIIVIVITLGLPHEFPDNQD